MKNTKIVCIGDSLTEGYQIALDSAWPDVLKRETKFELINSGICGDTTAGMLARFQEDVIKHKADYVIIMGGTNDIWFNIPDSQIIANILAMTRHARHHQIQSIIGIPTPFYLPKNANADRFFIDLKGMHSRLLEYEQNLRRFIKDDEQPFIDFTLEMTPDLFLEDGLHPNEEGHVRMFENARKSLELILE